MKTLKIIQVALLAVFSGSASASQFETIVEAIAVKSDATQTNNGWADTQKIFGVKWKWPYHKSGAHDSSMVGITKVGRDKNPNIGLTKISVTGARTFISEAQIEIQNEGENPSETAVRALFGSGKVGKLGSSCDANDHSYSEATYRFEKKGYKPVFIKYSSSWGASGSGGLDIKIANSLEDALGNCKLVK